MVCVSLDIGRTALHTWYAEVIIFCMTIVLRRGKGVVTTDQAFCLFVIRIIHLCINYNIIKVREGVVMPN